MIKKKIYVAGHKGLVGSAIVRELKNKGYKNIITIERKKLDLTNQHEVLKFLKKKSLTLYLLLQQKLVELFLTHKIKLILLPKIYKSKPI